MIRSLDSNHEWLKHPSFYNAYPLRNEIVLRNAGSPQKAHKYGDVFIDDYYGRIFDRESQDLDAKYGGSIDLNHYISAPSLEIVDELRVPYRRIPIFRAKSLDQIQQVYNETKALNPSHELLLRGQARVYFISRESFENEYFYGESEVREPSFLPSHLRSKFDPLFLKCMWQSQAAIMLNSIRNKIGSSVGLAAGNLFLTDVTAFRNSPAFIFFALGIAQHYGLPSVGLDLTDSLSVASWFATRTISVDSSGMATIGHVTSEDVPSVFIFRCPKDAVFNYVHAKGLTLPAGRPDRQRAWFGHVGWGAASNQLATYLVCGFRLDLDLVDDIDPILDKELFPKRSADPILDSYMASKESGRYQGEALRALQRIYYTAD